MPFRLEPVSASSGFRLEPVEAPMSTGAAGKAGAPEQPVTATGAATRALVNRTIQNTLNIPAAAAELLAPTPFPETEAQRSVDRIPFTDIRNPIPSPVDLIGRAGSAVAEGVRSITPDVSTVAALPGFFTGGPEGFQRERERILTEDIRQASEAPVATAIGGFGGDATTLLGLRSRLTRNRAAGERAAATAATREAAGITAPSRAAERAARDAAERLARLQERGGLRAVTSEATRSNLARLLGRGASRAGEAGVEGAVLAQLQDGDPITAAGAAAGVQLGQSAILHTLTPRNILAGVGLTTVGLLALEGLGPGQMRVLDASEDAVKKLLVAAGVVAAAGITGGGRTSSRNMAVLTDALTTLPRGTVQSAVRSLLEASPRSQAVMERFSREPNSFSRTEQRLLSRAIKDPKVSIDATVDRLGLR